MSKKLGICVTTQDFMTHVLGLAKAAKAAGVETNVFLTGEGVHLTQRSRFSKLLDAAKVGVCEVSFIAFGYKQEETQGMVDKDFVTQARNAEMVDECDRYLVM